MLRVETEGDAIFLFSGLAQRRPSGSTGQCLKSQFMLRIEAEGYAVFLFSGLAQRRAVECCMDSILGIRPSG